MSTYFYYRYTLCQHLVLFCFQSTKYRITRREKPTKTRHLRVSMRICCLKCEYHKYKGHENMPFILSNSICLPVLIPVEMFFIFIYCLMNDHAYLADKFLLYFTITVVSTSLSLSNSILIEYSPASRD